MIIYKAREVIQTGQKTHIEKLTELMMGHEIQQTAPIIATIAILIGMKADSLNIPINDDCNKTLSDIIKWDVKVIKEDGSWPERQRYSFIHQFTDPRETK